MFACKHRGLVTNYTAAFPPLLPLPLLLPCAAETSAGGATAPSRPVTLNWMFYDAPKVITLPCNSTLLLTWGGDEPHNVVQVPAGEG